jgi:DNA topoisomerase-1
MELIVAEKPNVAGKIATAIGSDVKQSRVGQVSYYETTNNGKRIVIASAVGHIYSLIEKKRTHSYPVFDIEWVPAYKADKGSAYTKQYLSILEKFGKEADAFISACDYDVEGSLIGWNVYRFATKIKNAKRMKFSALTHSDLLAAYKNASALDYNNCYAGETRHILDWYYGINLSRALMSSIRAAHSFRVMSIGRVQGPTLGILSELERKIAVFVPTPYWELSVAIKGAVFEHANGKFTEEESATLALKRTDERGTVSKIEKKEQSVPPNPPFDLTTLQVEAYRVFKFPPSYTLEIAQKLYEASLITYPRTSSQQFPPSINLPVIIKKLAENAVYQKEARTIIDNKWFTPLQGKKSDPAHPAIHPTGQKGQFGSEQEKKLYDLIVKRFLACFAPAAKKQRTKVSVNAGQEPYTASGVVTTEKGWTEIYGAYYNTDDKELPAFSEGESVSVEKKKKTKKMTKPPARYSEASIISELEKRHLGTKATRSAIIDTLFKREYITNKSIQVTDFGLKVCEVLKKYAPEILDDQLTRRLEDEMEEIQDGKKNPQEVITKGREILVSILDKWKVNERKIGLELLDALQSTMEKESKVGVCDKCGKNLRIIRMKNGKQFIGCHGYPECRNAYPLPGNALVKTGDKVCSACNKPVVGIIRKGKKPFEMCIDPGCPSKAEWRSKNESNK